MENNYRWTYCKDAKPKEEGEYIVSFIGGDKNRYTTVMWWFGKDWSGQRPIFPYAWMPLPEAPTLQ